MANDHQSQPWLSLVLLFVILTWLPHATDSAAATKSPIVCKNSEPITVDLFKLATFEWKSPPPPAKGQKLDCTLIVTRNLNDAKKDSDGKPSNSDMVKQIKLTFTAFQLNQPNSDGICKTDNLAILYTSKYAAAVPKNICGRETDTELVGGKNQTVYHHRYMKFLENGEGGIDNITFKITTSGGSDQKFNLKFLALKQSNVLYAPPGCSQYFVVQDNKPVVVRTPNYPKPLKSPKSKFPEKKLDQKICFTAGYKTKEVSEEFNKPIEYIILDPKGTGGQPAFTIIQNGTDVKTSLHNKACPKSQLTTASNARPEPLNRQFCGAHFNNNDAAAESSEDKPVKFIGRNYLEGILHTIEFPYSLYAGAQIGFRFIATAKIKTS